MKSLEEVNDRLEENALLRPNTIVLAYPPTSTRTLDSSDDHHSIMALPNTSSTSTVSDNRKINRGSSRRLRHTASQKADAILFFEDSNAKMTVGMLIKEHRLGKRFEKHLSTGKSGWKHSETRRNILIKASGDRCKNCKHAASGSKCSKNKFQLVELKLQKLIMRHRSRGRKVSK